MWSSDCPAELCFLYMGPSPPTRPSATSWCATSRPPPWPPTATPAPRAKSASAWPRPAPAPPTWSPASPPPRWTRSPWLPSPDRCPGPPSAATPSKKPTLPALPCRSPNTTCWSWTLKTLPSRSTTLSTSPAPDALAWSWWTSPGTFCWARRRNSSGQPRPSCPDTGSQAKPRRPRWPPPPS